MFRAFFQLTRFALWRPYLAALLVVGMLVTGLFGPRMGAEFPRPPDALQGALPSLTFWVAKPHQVMVRNGHRSEVERRMHQPEFAGSPPGSPEADVDMPAPAWSDLDRDVPRRPRFVIRKLPGGEDGDGDPDAPRLVANSLQPRAPPAQA